MLRRQDDLAELSALGEGVVSLLGPVERVRLVDGDDDAAIGEQRQDVVAEPAGPGCLLLAGAAAEMGAVDAATRAQQVAELDLDARARTRADDRQPALQRELLEVVRDQIAADELEDH